MSPCRLSVNCVAVLTAVLLLIVCAVISIAVTITFAIDASDDSARRFTSAIAHAGRTKVEDYIAMPVDKAVGLRASFKIPGVTPDFLNHSVAASERRAALDRFVFQRAPAFLEANFSCLYVGFGLEDGTWCSCFITDAATRSYTCDVLDLTITYAGNPGSGEWRQYTFTEEENTGVTIGPESYDPRDRPWYQAVKADGGSSARWRFSDTLVDYGFHIPIFDLNAPIVSPDGSFAGVTSVTLALRDLSTFLQQIPGTANSVTVLVDNKGLLLGMSDLSDLYTVVEKTNTTAAASQCEEVNTTHTLCRYSVLDTQSKVLHEAASALPTLFQPSSARPPESRSATIHNRGYYVVSNPVHHPMVSVGLEWRLVTVVPAMDLMGGIFRGRDIAIGLVAAVVVLSCIICAAVLYMLLRPLERVALRMAEVASLRGKATHAPVGSRLREVAAIESAFDNLNHQLQRALAFLPPSLRAALEEGDTDDTHHDDAAAECATPTLHTDNEDEGDPIQSEGSISESSHRSENLHHYRHHHHHHDGSSSAGTSECASGRRHVAAAASISTIQSLVTANANGGAKGTDSRLHVALATAVATQRTVTVVQLNLRGFHQQLAESRSGAAVALGLPYGALVSMVNATATANRGVIDVFCGDHFMLTFNAIRACASHIASATAAIQFIEERLTVPWTCGVACGSALVGNMGSTDTRRFTTVGNVVRQAAVLERLCKVIPAVASAEAATLVSRQVATESMHATTVLFVDVVPLPGNTTGCSPIAAMGAQLLTNAKGLCSSKNNDINNNDKARTTATAAEERWATTSLNNSEWMYELVDGATASPLKRLAVTLNDAFTALFRGDVIHAAHHAETFRKAFRNTDDKTASSVASSSSSTAGVFLLHNNNNNGSDDCPLTYAFNTLQAILTAVNDKKETENQKHTTPLQQVHRLVPSAMTPPSSLGPGCLAMPPSHHTTAQTATATGASRTVPVPSTVDVESVLQVVASYRSAAIYSNADLFNTVFVGGTTTPTGAGGGGAGVPAMEAAMVIPTVQVPVRSMLVNFVKPAAVEMPPLPTTTTTTTLASAPNTMQHRSRSFLHKAFV